MQKATLRTLLRDVRHLKGQHCPTEARLKIAMAFNRFEEAHILTCLDLIHGIEKNLPRPLERYRALVTERLLRHVREVCGAVVADKVTRALLD